MIQNKTRAMTIVFSLISVICAVYGTFFEPIAKDKMIFLSVAIITAIIGLCYFIVFMNKRMK